MAFRQSTATSSHPPTVLIDTNLTMGVRPMVSWPDHCYNPCVAVAAESRTRQVVAVPAVGKRQPARIDQFHPVTPSPPHPVTPSPPHPLTPPLR